MVRIFSDGKLESEYEYEDGTPILSSPSPASAGDARRRYRMGERESILFTRESVRSACGCAFRCSATTSTAKDARLTSLATRM